MDFSKIVELFDKHSASFVSITQHFNTTTSMGRLTLNVLLSFAQFEREVTGERIRDKIAASKKKGMWMSGMSPIGYELKDKKLMIDAVQSEKVRMIFQKYSELKSVPELKYFLDKNNIKTRSGKDFAKGILYNMLQNKVYIGLIVHKGTAYKGEQEAIIDNETFEKTQQLLSQNRITKKCAINSTNPSLLAGKIFDDKGNYMSPSHSNKNNKRYRYYVSQALIQLRKQDAGTISKIPAGEIETFVTNEIKTFLLNVKNIHQYIDNYDIHKQKDLLLTLKNLQTDLKGKLNTMFVRTVLSRIIIYKDKVDIVLCKDNLIKILEAITYNTSFPEELKNESQTPIFISVPIQIVQTPRKASVVIISESNQHKVNVNPQLVKAIGRSYYWSNLLCSGIANNCNDIKEMENLKDSSYITEIVNLRFLAPDIIERILNGTQPIDLTVQKLFKIKTLDWNEQRKLIY